MRKTILILLSLCIVSCSQKEVSMEQLVDRNGIMHEVNNDKPFTGKVFSKYENQQLKTVGFYKKGLKTGTWEHFKDNGQIEIRENYENGKLNGLTEKFNDKNIKYVSKEYKNDSLHGTYKGYDDNGGLSEEGVYKNDLKDGLWTSIYHDSTGQKRNYSNGGLHGQFIRYDKKGVVLEKGTYTDNMKEGVFTEYYSKDKKKDEYTFELGRLIKVKHWDEDQMMSFIGEYPGTCTWFNKKGNKLAEGYFTEESSLKKSSLKVLYNDKLIKPFDILSNSFWASNKVNFNMKYQNLRKKDYQERIQITESTFNKHQRFINGYGNSRVGWINGGRYEFDAHQLPQLYLTIFPENRSGSYKNYHVKSLSQNEMYLDNVRYHRVSNLFPD